MGKTPSEGAPSYAAALAAACEADAFDGDDEAAPVSIEVMALATRRLWRDAKFLPTPSEFRSACMEMRERVGYVHAQLIDGMQGALDLREQIEQRIASQGVEQVEDGWPDE
jgi:hypothetical protein